MDRSKDKTIASSTHIKTSKGSFCRYHGNTGATTKTILITLIMVIICGALINIHPTSANITNSAYLGIPQYRNLYIATGLSGNDTINITGTYLGSPAIIATLSSSNSWTAFGWSDRGTSATYPASSSESTAQERWTIGNPYTTEAITFGGGFYGKAYTHQYNVTFQYSTSDGKAIPDGTIIGRYTQFGQEHTFATTSQYQATSPLSDWVDAQTQVLLQNYTNTLNTTVGYWQILPRN